MKNYSSPWLTMIWCGIPFKTANNGAFIAYFEGTENWMLYIMIFKSKNTDKTTSIGDILRMLITNIEHWNKPITWNFELVPPKISKCQQVTTMLGFKGSKVYWHKTCIHSISIRADPHDDHLKINNFKGSTIIANLRGGPVLILVNFGGGPVLIL